MVNHIGMEEPESTNDSHLGEMPGKEIEIGDSFRFTSDDGKVIGESISVVGNAMHHPKYWVLGSDKNLYSRDHCVKISKAHEPIKNKYMNIDLTVIEERKIEREIDVPFFSKDPCCFRMITKNETIVSIHPNGSSNMTDSIEIFEPTSIHYESTLIRTIEAKEITEAEFTKQFYKVRDRIDKLFLNRDLAGFKNPEVTEAITEDQTF